MHPLLQLSTIALTSKERRQAAFDKAQSLLLGMLPMKPALADFMLFSTWELFSKLSPHILSIVGRYHEWKGELDLPLTIGELLERFVKCVQIPASCNR
jgi:hypothetical protein